MLFTDLDALVDGEVGVALESLQQLIRFHLGHELDIPQDGLLGEFRLGKGTADYLLQVLQLQLLVVRQHLDELLLNLRQVVVDDLLRLGGVQLYQ